MTMKIALVTDAIYPFTLGGSEIRNYEIAKRLVRRGHEVHIYGAKWWEGPEVISHEGTVLHGMHPFSQGLYGKNKRRSELDMLLLSVKIGRKLLHEDYDIIDNLSFNHPNCYAIKPVSMIKKTPLVFTWQQYFGDSIADCLGSSGLGKLKGKVIKQLERISTKLADYNVACSMKVKEELKKRGVKSGKIKVIYNGCSLSDIERTKSLGEDHDLIFVGRMHYQKNPQLFLETLVHLKRHSPGIRAAMIGTGPEDSNLKAYAREHNLTGNVIFKGPVKEREEIYRHMKSSKMMVLTSRFEGFPLVIVEAHACRTPVVSTDYSGGNVKEIIKNKELIAGQSAEELAEKIKLLLEGSERIRDVVKKPGTDAKKFDWNVIADETEAFYGRIMKN
jgi:glycosyltransferase involved in cell wall biosynthesis